MKAGIKSQMTHSWGKEFSDRNFSVMIEGSWLPSNLDAADFSKVGFIPKFPTPDNDTLTATLMGGWELPSHRPPPTKIWHGSLFH